MAANKQSNKLYVALGVGMVVLVILIKLFGGASNAPSAGSGAIPPLTGDDWIEGSRTAGVVVTEYSDFQCPACGGYYPIVKQLYDKFSKQIAIVYRHFPLTSVHPNAFIAAQAAEAAGKQNAFWQMHDLLFEKQNEWGTDPTPFEKFVGYARTLNLNVDQFTQDYNSSAVKDRIVSQASAGEAAGINSTPTFYVNGEKIQNPRSLDEFSAVIDAAIKKAPLSVGADGTVNMNADFAVYVNGNKLDFSAAKYTTRPTSTMAASSTVDNSVSLLSEKPSIIHIAKQGATLSAFFSSLKFALTDDCLITDANEKYCGDATHSLKIFVNGARVESPAAYVLGDLDRILVSYGPLGDDAVVTQIASVTDDACVYSKKCLPPITITPVMTKKK